MSIQNPFRTKVLRPDRKSTLFKRVYNRLSEKKLDPGKVIPLFTYINDNHKLFGAITLNLGGSVSFFPDFYHLSNFDHLTLSKDFMKKKGHTTPTDSRNEKINIEATALAGNDYYHLITFGMDSDDLLMDSPSEIQIPHVSYTTKEEKEKYTKWIEGSAHGYSVLKFPEGDGSYFVQVLILPKGRPTTELAVERSFVENILECPISLESKTITAQKIDIPTPDKSDFSICILTFRVENRVRGTFSFMMAQDPLKPVKV